MTREEYKDKLIQSGIAKGNKKKKKQTAVASKYPQGYFKAKACKHCGAIFTPKAPSELSKCAVKPRSFRAGDIRRVCRLHVSVGGGQLLTFVV